MTVQGASSPDAPRYDDVAREYDAVLVMSFGGPEAPDEVVPFLENVTRGRNIPRERLEEVGEHYYMFGGRSPINDQNKELIAALEEELAEHNLNLPVYYGNRNWHPMIEDTLRQMRDDGVKRAIAFFTSGFSCYSGCRQYREDVMRAQEVVGEGAPEVDRLRLFFNHPGFLEPVAQSIRDALKNWDEAERDDVHLVFTAHSIPMGMARNSAYEAQLKESCRIVAEDLLDTTNYALVYQSRSGPSHMPWLEPDILDYMTEMHEQGKNNLVIMPIGFISDHMEVVFDLDTEARQLADEIGMKMVRAQTIHDEKPFVQMIRELIVERMTENPERRTLGNKPPLHDICPVDCCLPGARPARKLQQQSAEA